MRELAEAVRATVLPLRRLSATLTSLDRFAPTHVTNLRLTGQALTMYDLARMGEHSALA